MIVTLPSLPRLSVRILVASGRLVHAGGMLDVVAQAVARSEVRRSGRRMRQTS
jgi:hypothetical protein